MRQRMEGYRESDSGSYLVDTGLISLFQENWMVTSCSRLCGWVTLRPRCHPRQSAITGVSVLVLANRKR